MTGLGAGRLRNHLSTSGSSDRCSSSVTDSQTPGTHPGDNGDRELSLSLSVRETRRRGVGDHTLSSNAKVKNA